MNLHLIPIKTSRKKPKTGDVFLVQPIKGVYYYGKVISEKSNSKYELIKDFPLIYIYNQTTTNFELPNFLSNILIAPLITNYSPWTRGYFYTIGNIPVTDEEKNLDCGFKDFPITDFNNECPFFRNIHGKRIDYKPQFNTSFGLCSYKGVNFEICKILGIDD